MEICFIVLGVYSNFFPPYFAYLTRFRVLVHILLNSYFKCIFHVYFEIIIKFVFKLVKKKNKIDTYLSAKILFDETSVGRVFTPFI